MILVQVVFSLVGLWAPPDLYDQGIYLSSARFVADGLVPFRDFLSPYGPGLSYANATLIWAQVDYLPAHRLLWALGHLVLSVLLLRLAARRGLLPIGVAVLAALLLLPVAPTYLVPGICVLLAVEWLDREVPRIGGALLVLGVAAWFRWDFLAVLGLAGLLLLLTTAGRRLTVIAWGAAATVVALAPYALLASLGGLGGMRQAVEYALFSFAEFRGLPYPWSAPVGLVRALFELEPGSLLNHAVEILGYLLAPMAVVVALVAVIRAGNTRQVLTQPAVLVALSWGAVSLYSLRVRADAFHASPLILALGVVLLMLVPPGLKWVRVDVSRRGGGRRASACATHAIALRV